MPKKQVSFEPENENIINDEEMINNDNYLAEMTPTTVVDPVFIDEQERLLFSESKYGEDMINFLNSDLGRLIRGSAKHDMNEALNGMKDTAPWRKQRMQKFQNQYRVAESLVAYCAEIIQRGEHAFTALENHRNKEET